MAELPKPAVLGAWFALGSGSFEALAERLVEAGCEVRWDDALSDAARFYVADPWGNRLELMAAA